MSVADFVCRMSVDLGESVIDGVISTPMWMNKNNRQPHDKINMFTKISSCCHGLDVKCLEEFCGLILFQFVYKYKPYADVVLRFINLCVYLYQIIFYVLCW